MLISVRRLVERVRGRRARSTDVASVKQKLDEAPRPDQVSPELLALALEMHALRAELTQKLSGVRSCSGCARGYPLPYGRWSGGHCCGGRTEALFTADEIASLALAGTRAARIDGPPAEAAGCAFRGPAGCSLEPVDRPNLCVRYTCRELEAELAQAGTRREVEALQIALKACFERFIRLRAEAEVERELAELRQSCAGRVIR
jgi:hypothetical protein